MNGLSFNGYRTLRERDEAREDLARYLVESGVDIERFNEGLGLIAEWGWNPFKTFGKSAATGTGAVLGSALGPVGTAVGGLAGNVAGELGSKALGKFIGKARVQSIAPVYQQAVQAVNTLSQMLDAPDMQSVPDAQNLKQNVMQVHQNLDLLKDKIGLIDQQRNANLDMQLNAGKGWGGKLRGASGDNSISKGMRWLGDKIKNIPILNQDMGLRRAISKGMDGVQQWAANNPKKAAALNIGAAGAGALTGALGAAGVKSAFSGDGVAAAPVQKSGGVQQGTTNTSTGTGLFMNGREMTPAEVRAHDELMKGVEPWTKVNQGKNSVMDAIGDPQSAWGRRDDGGNK